MDDAFGKFKITLSDDLTIPTCRKLCTYFGITPAKTESILLNEPQGLVLLNHLECESKFTQHSMQDLHDALIHIKMIEAARKVEEFARYIDKNSQGARRKEVSRAGALNRETKTEFPTSTEEAVNELIQHMQNIPQNMRAFCLGMRALYATKEVSSQAESGREFKQLRESIKRDALVYINGIFPVSTTLVRSISQFFEHSIEGREMDEMRESLPDIIQDARGYKQCCEEVLHLHQDILISLKRRQDDALALLYNLKTLSVEMDEKTKKLEEEASSKKASAWRLAFVHIVGSAFTPILLHESKQATAEAAASGFQCSSIGEAALVVSDTMIPALNSFISGIEKEAGFFLIIEQELTNFKSRGEKAMNRFFKLHYIMMKKKAAGITGRCKTFNAMIPGVRLDFGAIPYTPSDQNYVDEWLAKNKSK